MIQQTYFPFSGELTTPPISSPTLLSGISPTLDNPMHQVGSNFNWLMLFFLIATLLGIMGVVYWWKEKISEDV